MYTYELPDVLGEEIESRKSPLSPFKLEGWVLLAWLPVSGETAIFGGRENWLLLCPLLSEMGCDDLDGTVLDRNLRSILWSFS